MYVKTVQPKLFVTHTSCCNKLYCTVCCYTVLYHTQKKSPHTTNNRTTQNNILYTAYCTHTHTSDESKSFHNNECFRNVKLHEIVVTSISIYVANYFMVPYICWLLIFYIFRGNSADVPKVSAIHYGHVVKFSAGELGKAKTYRDEVRGAMTINETAGLIRYIMSADKYFEFGSGGSTQLACLVGKPTLEIWTVDSSASFLQGVMARPCLKNISVDRIHAITVDIGPTGNWGYPLNEDEHHRHKWAAYSKATSNITSKLDVILIDGRFRIACAVQAMLHHPRSKILIHDFFAEHSNHREYRKLLNISQIVESTENLVWIKKKAEVTEIELKKWWLSHNTTVD